MEDDERPPAAADGHARPAVSRRRFLRDGLGAATLFYLADVPGAMYAAAAPGDPGPTPGPPPPPSLSFVKRVRRREDMVDLTFRFYNLQLDDGAPDDKRLVRISTAQAAYIVVEFGPQSVMEQTVLESNSTPEFGSLESRLSGKSRLAFLLPATVVSIPYSLAALLSWADYPLRVARHALPPGETTVPSRSGLLQVTPPIAKPKTTETSVELPWWLVISPNRFGRFVNATEPVVHDDRYEIFHTRLAVFRDGEVTEGRTEPLRTGRALWTSDPQLKDSYLLDPNNAPQPTDNAGGQPFPSAMRVRDRVDLVRVTSDFKVPGYQPQPFDIENLMLTPLGGWLDVNGSWDAPSTLSSLINWRHRATQGRDHYVRIIRKGYLLPFGHACVEVTISERKIRRSNNVAGAYLEKRTFLVVRRPNKHYPGYRQDFGGRSLPFSSVRITTLVTPPIVQDLLPGAETVNPQPYFPMVEQTGEHVLFHCVGTDRGAQPVDFATPMLFVESTEVFNNSDMTTVRDAYNALPDTDPRRARPFLGQLVAMAQPNEPGDTSVEVQQIVFSCERPTLQIEVPGSDQVFENNDQPRCHPAMKRATVRLGELERASGGGLPDPDAVWDLTYLADGIDAGSNKANLFIVFETPPELRYATDKSGAILAPNLDVTGLSRSLGPVGGDTTLLKQQGTFDPEQFFGSTPVKLLGGIDIWDVVQVATFAGGTVAPPPEVLTVVRRELADAVETRLDWRPLVKSDPLGFFEPADDDQHLLLEAVIRTDLADSSKSTVAVRGELSNFTLRMLGDALPLIELDISRLAFSTRTGEKPDIEIKVDNSRFVGVMGFIEEFKDYLSFGGNGFSLELTPTAINAGFTLAIPSITVGVFAITDLTFGFGLNIPISGDAARARVNFSSREDPFHLTVMCIGGGGWVELGFGLDGFEWFEIGFEAGAELALNFGVASGSVHVFIGFYFRMEEVSGGVDVSLGGYLRIGGEVDVMGLISASIELRLELDYLFKSGPPELEILHGRASLTVEVDVLIFSGSVEIEVEKSFGGDPADPTFEQYLPDPALWQDYCEAFAPVGV